MKLKIYKVGTEIVKIIFVDAYNVINSWPEFKKIKDLDFELTRQRLIDIMENYAVFNGCKMFLVFDAYNSEIIGDRKQDISFNLSIIYTSKGELADTYIERIAHKIAKKTEIMVVTSDYMEQQIIFQRGAYRISCLEFYNEVYGANNKLINKINQNNQNNSRFLLADNLDKNVLEKLEKIRRIK